ncbi:MAG: hypothetical protein COX77_05075 [Candidatus Komeilibacteria bacterium CG_4_10_14_0_2_um_filter_37_10]|uniref:Haloacid dehalogenase n=1 Tax=Candidatus Komeilibacteria bacterium CG_4_10_14_0_2_um_filter_37_10 TaxID=1974470 RepID=A0A2M7VD55_9BACT|nr:MAG: hypothetical protein COX77_05075 [Candidatus Komeilibacteria bacterium CG_4_10_14_0_2_um_filter_37_10]
MLNKKLISKISQNLGSFQKERDYIFNRSREILQNAKEAIFAAHRQDFKMANNKIAAAEKILLYLQKEYNKDNRLKFEGSYKACLEEYVEAKMFIAALLKQELKEVAGINIGPEEYIGGLADMTGELVRQAVLQATASHYDSLIEYRRLSEEIVATLMKLYLTGALRQKFDEAKRNLKRLEQIQYDITIRHLDHDENIQD